MRIGEIAAQTDVTAKTIRYWEDLQLLPEPSRTPSGYRDYRPEIVERLVFIRHGQTAGFTLGEIGQILEISDSGEAPCEHVATLIDDRLAEVESRIAELAETRRRLQSLARRAAAQDPAECDGYCTIITGDEP